MTTTRALALITAVLLVVAGCGSGPELPVVIPSTAPRLSTQPAASPPSSAVATTPIASIAAAPTPTPTPTPSPGMTALPFALMTIETRGGECAASVCDRLVNIEPDGKIHLVIPEDRSLGTVPKELLDALWTEIEQANYPLLQSRPFAGTCPTAVDGQEVIYTFHVATGDEEVASCKVAIDPKHPLFRAIAAALAYQTP